MIRGKSTSATSVTAQGNIPDDSNLHNCRRGNLQSNLQTDDSLQLLVVTPQTVLCRRAAVQPSARASVFRRVS
jgi:hypothetical protein